jgi:4-amino-4-deoxy-L-arabinose transferase-like glycosyltransferase
VAQTDNSPTRSSAFSLARIAWTILILATLYVCYFHNLGALGFVGPDEPRYASIARDMAETGDWVTPRLYGKPWFEKPILYYWAAAVSFKLFGVSEVAARLPSALAALLATLAVAWLAWRIYGAETGRWFLLLLPATVGMIGFSHAAATDMPFAAMLSVALVFAVRLLRLDPSASLISFTSSASFTSFFFGLFLGLAVLAKGPAAIVLSGGAVFLWAVFTKRWRDACRCLHPVGIISFCLVALPWYIQCARRNPDFFRVFVIEHNFKRYLTPEFQHIQPFWFYIPIILLAVFPWTFLLIPAARKFFHDKQERTPAFAFQLFLACWAAFPLLFFSISQSKLPGYILPTVPPLLLILSEAVSARIQDMLGPPRWPGLLLASGLIALGVLFVFASRRVSTNFYSADAPGTLAHLALFVILAGIVVLLFGVIRSNTIALFATILVLLVAMVRSDNLFARLDADLTAREAALDARKLWPGFSASRAATWHLKRSLCYQLNFYTHTQLPDWTPPNAKPEWLFIDPERMQEALARDFTCATFVGRPAVIPCKLRDSTASFGGFTGSSGNSADGQAR